MDGLFCPIFDLGLALESLILSRENKRKSLYLQYIPENLLEFRITLDICGIEAQPRYCCKAALVSNVKLNNRDKANQMKDVKLGRNLLCSLQVSGQMVKECLDFEFNTPLLYIATT